MNVMCLSVCGWNGYGNQRWSFTTNKIVTCYVPAADKHNFLCCVQQRDELKKNMFRTKTSRNILVCLCIQHVLRIWNRISHITTIDVCSAPKRRYKSKGHTQTKCTFHTKYLAQQQSIGSAGWPTLHTVRLQTLASFALTKVSTQTAAGRFHAQIRTPHTPERHNTMKYILFTVGNAVKLGHKNCRIWIGGMKAIEHDEC